MKVRTYINEPKRTIVVVIDDTEYDFIRRMRKLIRGQHRDDFSFNGAASYILGPVRGKARCHPDDEWNEAVGIEIARDRAFAKYNAKWNQEVDDLLERMEVMQLNIEALYRDE